MISKFQDYTVVTDAYGRVTSLSSKAPKFADSESRDFCTQVAAFFSFDVERLFRIGRGQRVAFVRQVASYALRELTDMSYPEIAEVFAQHHSTIIHSHKLIAKRVAAEPAFAKTIARLKARLVGEYQTDEAA
jgi:chromosomal replication initiation ATPase DnaA